SEFRSAKAKFPYTRQLTILETICNPTSRLRGAGISYVPVHLEPCAILRGKWLKDAGFSIGQKITIQVSGNELIITPSFPFLNIAP
ncbi:MAG: SymE family type I addiction module toxin, partial [Pseudomonadales bacterium]